MCKEVYFFQEKITVDSNLDNTENPGSIGSNIHIMDNPERRNNFGLLAGNSKNHAYFGLSCNFQELKLKFNACNKCSKEIPSIVKMRGRCRQNLLRPSVNSAMDLV